MTDVGILGVGVATMDIYVIQKRMYPGGNEYNVAYNAKMLGARAGFLGVFANNPAGELLERTLIEGGVDTSFSHHEEGSSGYCIVKLKEDGDRVFLEWNQEGVTDLHPIMFTKEELDYVKKYDVVSLGRCASVSLDKIQMLASEGVKICYDFHAAFTDEDIERIAPYIFYGFFSCSHLDDEEARRVLKKAIDCGCRIAIGTNGSDPIIAYDGERYFVQNTCKVEATDALGAGDSYIGAFLVSYISLRKDGMDQKKGIQTALYLAAKHAATVVVKEGSVGVGYDVDLDEISNIVNKNVRISW